MSATPTRPGRMAVWSGMEAGLRIGSKARSKVGRVSQGVWTSSKNWCTSYALTRTASGTEEAFLRCSLCSVRTPACPTNCYRTITWASL
eukprot:856951-Pyramimonas_sp.AAC.1